MAAVDLAGAPAAWNGSRQPLPEEVAAYVRELIISGKVRPGEYLRMEPIAESLGVSNTPVREGLLALRSEGFVRQVPRRGFVVAPFTPRDVRDLFWAQATLASELAARAAKSITPEQVERLEDNLEQYESAIGKADEELIARLGHVFHREVNLAAESHRLALLLGSVTQQLPNTFYAGIEGHLAATRQDHQLLLDALRRRQARKAREIMHHHIISGGDRLLEQLEHQGIWDAEASAGQSLP